jgi:transcriptional regulator with XRE-family HTH domain
MVQTKVINMTGENETTVYKSIEAARQMQRLSYEQLAQRIGISRMGLHKTLKNKSLTVETMFKLADVLHIDYADLFATHEDLLAVHEPGATYGISVNAKLNRIKQLADEIQKDLDKM